LLNNLQSKLIADIMPRFIGLRVSVSNCDTIAYVHHIESD